MFKMTNSGGYENNSPPEYIFLAHCDSLMSNHFFVYEDDYGHKSTYSNQPYFLLVCYLSHVSIGVMQKIYFSRTLHYESPAPVIRYILKQTKDTIFQYKICKIHIMNFYPELGTC